MEFLIRDAVLDDMDALADVFRRSSLSNEGDRALIAAHPEFLVFADENVRAQRTRVAVDGSGHMLGFATTLVAGDVDELEDLFVDPDWMRNGIASDLIADVARRARDRGATRIEVTANEHAFPFYLHAGFVQEGEADTQGGPQPRMHLDLAP
jgi:GNAT superfamily N-acetyltransferase